MELSDCKDACINPGSSKFFALGIEADTGLWLMPVQYEWIARPQATPFFGQKKTD
jgi:hypothetical protein